MRKKHALIILVIAAVAVSAAAGVLLFRGIPGLGEAGNGGVTRTVKRSNYVLTVVCKSGDRMIEQRKKQLAGKGLSEDEIAAVLGACDRAAGDVLDVVVHIERPESGNESEYSTVFDEYRKRGAEEYSKKILSGMFGERRTVYFRGKNNVKVYPDDYVFERTFGYTKGLNMTYVFSKKSMRESFGLPGAGKVTLVLEKTGPFGAGEEMVFPAGIFK